MQAFEKSINRFVSIGSFVLAVWRLDGGPESGVTVAQPHVNGLNVQKEYKIICPMEIRALGGRKKNHTTGTCQPNGWPCHPARKKYCQHRAGYFFVGKALIGPTNR